MMFHYSDTAVHPSRFYRSNPLFGIRHCQRGINLFIFITISPFSAGKGIHTVMEESIELGLVPKNLSLVWNRVAGCRHIIRIGKFLRYHLKALGNPVKGIVNPTRSVLIFIRLQKLLRFLLSNISRFCKYTKKGLTPMSKSLLLLIISISFD